MNTEPATRTPAPAVACEHRFTDTPRCLKCGFAPPPASVLHELFLLWEHATFEERRTFLLQTRFTR